MAPQTDQPPLVYDRVGQNRRRTWFLIALAFAVFVPSAMAAGYLLARLTILCAGALAGAQAMAACNQHMLGFTLVTTSGVAAVLGILFWAIASSPGSRLLVQAGARLAAPGEKRRPTLVGKSRDRRWIAAAQVVHRRFERAQCIRRRHQPGTRGPRGDHRSEEHTSE